MKKNILTIIVMAVSIVNLVLGIVLVFSIVPASNKTAALVAQLTASVRWTQSVKNMVADGATDFTECGPGAVLQGLIKKIDGTVNAHGIA